MKQTGQTRLLRFVPFVHLPYIFRSFDLFVASLLFIKGISYCVIRRKLEPLDRAKLDQIAARNIRISLDKPINKSEATKRSKDRKIYGKCTNGTNRRSRVWPVCFIYVSASS